MEQNLMVQHSSGKNYKPKGFNGRKVLQVALLLAVSIWLLYQMTHSHDKHKSYGGNTHNKLSKEIDTILLGRRGKVGFKAPIGFKDGNALEEDVVREDLSDGEDEFDRIIEIKEDEMRQYKEAPSNGTAATVSFKDSAEESYSKVLEGEEMEPETIGEEEMESKEDNANTQVREEDEEESFVDEEVQEDEGSERDEENIDLQDSEAEEMTNNPGQAEMGYGVHGFHDENGVLPDDLNSL